MDISSGGSTGLEVQEMFVRCIIAIPRPNLHKIPIENRFIYIFVCLYDVRVALIV